MKKFSMSNVLNFPSPRWLTDQIEWEREWEDVISYYAYDSARRTYQHREWFEHILHGNKEHYKRYPKSFARKVAKHWGGDKADFWIHLAGDMAVIEVLSFQEFMENIR